VLGCEVLGCEVLGCGVLGWKLGVCGSGRLNNAEDDGTVIGDAMRKIPVIFCKMWIFLV